METNTKEPEGIGIWTVWFNNQDGTPRTKYMPLAYGTELILTYVKPRDEFILTIKLQLRGVNVDKEVTLVGTKDEPATWEKMQDIALKTAEQWLTNLKSLTDGALAKVQTALSNSKN